MMNPLGGNLVQPMPGMDMSLKTAKPKVGAIGIKGPWHLDPGNPAFPNHRPYLTNIEPPNEVASTKPTKLKFT